MFEYPTYNENLKIFTCWWVFLFVEGDEFVVKLLADKVIRNNVYFYPSPKVYANFKIIHGSQIL